MSTVYKMKILGKTLKEYILPIKYYVMGAVLVVISQYYIALPLSDRFPFILNLTQALCTVMVALSVIKLVLFHNFKFKNVLVLGVLYSFIIHFGRKRLSSGYSYFLTRIFSAGKVAFCTY